MKMIFKALVISILSLLLFTGCRTTTINNIVAPIPITENKEKIESSIAFGVLNANWEVIKVSDNMLRARYSKSHGKHVLLVDIPFNEKEYEIKYYKSINLKYDPEENTIHSAYLTWTKNLRESIDLAIANKAIYYGTLNTTFDETEIRNEYNDKYTRYFYNVNKVNLDKSKISILKAKSGYGFIRIDEQEMVNQFGNAVKKILSKNSKFSLIDYIYMQPGEHEVVLGDTKGRIDTLVFDVKPGHEYLFDYSNTNDEKTSFVYWIQDLTDNKRVYVTHKTSFADRAFFMGKKVSDKE
jgi:hypothetical protein